MDTQVAKSPSTPQTRPLRTNQIAIEMGLTVYKLTFYTLQKALTKWNNTDQICMVEV